MKKLILFLTSVVIYFTGCSTDEPGIYEPDTDGRLLKSFPSLISLPDGFAPEGIATGSGSTFYTGSLATGEIYKGDYRTGEGSVLVAASARFAYGLSYDPRSNYLFVAGGTTGSLYIYDGTSGDLVAEYAVPGAVFINDVIVTRDAAYMTESLEGVLYKLSLGAAGQLSGTVEIIPLSGDFNFIENAGSPFGINVNGIETSPDGRYLIINDMADSNLYRVDPATGFAELIDLGEGKTAFADGLVLQGHTLYVVQNVISQVSEINLGPDFLSGTIEEIITHPALEVPATAALFGNSLYAVNARFGLPPGPFNIVKIQK